MTTRLTHGGDWAGFETEYGRPPLDFSANISPLGVPAGVQAAIRAAAPEADRYPDPLCRGLREKLGEHEGVPADWIFCGDGAADLIFRAALALRPRRALVTAPAFAEYETALSMVGCETVHCALREEDGFRLPESFPDEITPGIDMVFLCEPNNPTGVTTPRPLLERVLEQCREAGAVLVLDECFGDLLDEPEAHTLRGRLGEYPNLLILRAFTKLYAMAGVRLGYVLCSDGRLLASLRAAGQPWNVSSLAQAAGAAALDETEYVTAVRALVRRERPWLMEQLKALGLRVIPGEANYLLFRSAKPLCAPMRQRGILLRSCANYIGLDDTWYRTAVRGREDNARLIAALKEVLA